jgi:hypothetical protein
MNGMQTFEALEKAYESALVQIHKDNKERTTLVSDWNGWRSDLKDLVRDVAVNGFNQRGTTDSVEKVSELIKQRKKYPKFDALYKQMDSKGNFLEKTNKELLSSWKDWTKHIGDLDKVRVNLLSTIAKLDREQEKDKRWLQLLAKFKQVESDYEDHFHDLKGKPPASFKKAKWLGDFAKMKKVEVSIVEEDLGIL